jgi:hypothetical protein
MKQHFSLSVALVTKYPTRDVATRTAISSSASQKSGKTEQSNSLQPAKTTILTVAATTRNTTPMQYRSTILVWLLVVANVCINVILLSWARQSSFEGAVLIVYFAMLTAQLSAVCIWSGLRPKPNWWTRLAPLLAVVAVSVAFALVGDPVTDFFPYFGIHALALLVLLWVFRRTRFSRRLTGTEADWQFSIGHLLAAMTLLALLLVGLRYSDVFTFETGTAVAFLSASVAMAIGATLIWSLRIHWVLRLAGVAALAFGLSVSFTLESEYMLQFALYHFAIQAAVLTLWLAWGSILPIPLTTAVAATAASESRSDDGNP